MDDIGAKNQQIPRYKLKLANFEAPKTFFDKNPRTNTTQLSVSMYAGLIAEKFVRNSEQGNLT